VCGCSALRAEQPHTIKSAESAMRQPRKYYIY